MTGATPLTPAADQLAATVAASSGTWPGAAVLRTGLRLATGNQDRRGQLELHGLLAVTSTGLTAADRKRHLAEAERLLSAFDEDYLRLFVASVRSSVEGKG